MSQILIDGLYRVVCPVDGSQADIRVAHHQMVSCSHASELPECPGECRAKQHLLDPQRAHRICVECPELGQSAEVFVRHGRVESCSLSSGSCGQSCLHG